MVIGEDVKRLSVCKKFVRREMGGTAATLAMLVFFSFGAIGCKPAVGQMKATHKSSSAGAVQASKEGVSSNKRSVEEVDLNDENHYLNPDLPPRPPAPKGIEGGKLARATFAGGCFWCMEKPFETVNGVKSVTSGYTGGTFTAPSYKAVSSHSTDQVEAIDVIYDPKVVSYSKLLDTYWRQIDPTDDGGQFVDRGHQYRPVIWYHNDAQRKDAEASKAALAATGRYEKPLTVPILPAVTFWPAEEYHQDFYKKSPIRYHGYRSHSGRDQYLKKIWGKPTAE